MMNRNMTMLSGAALALSVGCSTTQHSDSRAPLTIEATGDVTGDIKLGGQPARISVFEGDKPRTVEWVELEFAGQEADISLGLNYRLQGGMELDLSGIYELVGDNQIVVAIEDSLFVSQSGKMTLEQKGRKLGGSFEATLRSDTGDTSKIAGDFFGTSSISCSNRGVLPNSGIIDIDGDNWTVDTHMESEFCQSFMRFMR